MDTIKIKYTELNRHPDNCRFEYDERSLMLLILQDKQLKEPIHIVVRKKGGYNALRGNRRTLAIKLGFEEHPEAFAAIFPNDEVACYLVKGLTAREESRYIVDHGNVKPLSGGFEMFLAVSLLSRSGMSESEIVVELGSLLNTATPLKKKSAISEIAELKAVLRRAFKAEDSPAIKAAGKKLKLRIVAARHGQMQLYSQLDRLPRIVLASWQYSWTGSLMRGFLQEDLNLRLSANQTGKLATAFKSDCERGFNKTKLGPEFSSLWKEYASKKEDKSRQTKAKTSGQIKEPLEKGQIASEGMAAIIRHHAGDPEVQASAIEQADEILAIVELVKEVDISLWETCVEMYEERQGKEQALLLQVEVTEPENETSNK